MLMHYHHHHRGLPRLESEVEPTVRGQSSPVTLCCAYFAHHIARHRRPRSRRAEGAHLLTKRESLKGLPPQAKSAAAPLTRLRSSPQRRAPKLAA